MDKVYQDIVELYEKYTGSKPEFSVPLPQTASNRQYFRLSGNGNSLIACYNPDRAENEAFIYIREILAREEIPVPKIFLTNLDRHIYLQEDLGDVKLLDLTEGYRKNNSTEYLDWYKLVIDQMPAIQYQSARDFDFSVCFPREAFDRQSILWDLNYFKYYFLKLTYIPFHEQKLEDDFARLADFLLEAETSFFLFRDFQSRNIMIHDDKVKFIDFQGGRKGALQYDLASLLFEAKAGLSAYERKELLAYYLEVYNQYDFFSKEQFLKYFPAYCLIRLLQAFGAYGYRGYFEKKSLFLQSIPPALNNLKWILDEYDLKVNIPYLKEVLGRVITSFKPPETTPSPDKLLVSVASFSYKKGKGIPQDYTGHGGGFIYDCRALPNPGRIDAYKTQTGLDPEVIDFFKEKQEVSAFIKLAEEMVSASVENYLARGHEHLMVSFGCTGGQHRSVYCAQQLYRYLKEKFDVRISINHIELEDSKDGGLYVQEEKKG